MIFCHLQELETYSRSVHSRSGSVASFASNGSRSSGLDLDRSRPYRTDSVSVRAVGHSPPSASLEDISKDERRTMVHDQVSEWLSSVPATLTDAQQFAKYHRLRFPKDGDTESTAVDSEVRGRKEEYGRERQEVKPEEVVQPSPYISHSPSPGTQNVNTYHSCPCITPSSPLQNHPLAPSKPFQCPKPNCNKSYKRAEGLKYHMVHGSCPNAPPKDLDSHYVKNLLEQMRGEREATRADNLSSTPVVNNPNRKIKCLLHHPHRFTISQIPNLNTGN